MRTGCFLLGIQGRPQLFEDQLVFLSFGSIFDLSLGLIEFLKESSFASCFS